MRTCVPPGCTPRKPIGFAVVRRASTATKGKSIHVFRKIDVARMDEFIGPKS
jgi:hypothetical protein